jgi:hypothetical protein
MPAWNVIPTIPPDRPISSSCASVRFRETAFVQVRDVEDDS